MTETGRSCTCCKSESASDSQSAADRSTGAHPRPGRTRLLINSLSSCDWMRIGNPLWNCMIPDNCQSFSTLPATPLYLRIGQIPNVIDDETLRGVEQRQRAAGFVIERIHRLFKAGRPVQGLAERVSRLQLQSVRETLLQACLERVVGRSGDRILGEDVAERRNAVHRATRSHSAAGHRIAIRRRIRTQAGQEDAVRRHRCRSLFQQESRLDCRHHFRCRAQPVHLAAQLPLD